MARTKDSTTRAAATYTRPTHCHDDRHATPCPLPCVACENDCGLIFDSCGSCGADLGPSTTYPWHYEDEDCRAVRVPS